MSTLLESRLSPQQRAQACAADAAELAAEAAMRNLRAAQAVRVTLNSAGQAINAALRPCFEHEFGTYPSLFDVLMADAEPTRDQEIQEARDQATDVVLSYAESVADWLAQACNTDAGREPLDVSVLTDMQVIDGSAATLLAVVMTGDNKQVLRAVHRLREMAATAYVVEIESRAAELLAEGAL